MVKENRITLTDTPFNFDGIHRYIRILGGEGILYGQIDPESGQPNGFINMSASLSWKDVKLKNIKKNLQD